MNIGEWIKACRAAAALTQSQLGDRLNVSKGNVSAWETGKHEPSYGQVVEIARTAGFSVPLPGMPAHNWPFHGIRPDEYFRLLSDREQGQIEERALALIEAARAKSDGTHGPT